MGKPPTVKTDPVMEAIARKLSGLEGGNLPLDYKRRMVKAVVKAGKEEAKRQARKDVEQLRAAIREFLDCLHDDDQGQDATVWAIEELEKVMEETR